MTPKPIEKLDEFLETMPVQIGSAIRALGLDLRQDEHLPYGISGHIRKLPDGRYEIASAAGEPLFRQRFTQAHELGHYVLHRSLLGNGVNDDRMYRTLRDSALYNRQIDDVHERQANSFAANVLMPEALIRRYLGWYGSVRDLAQAFNVSRQSMRWRLNNLGLLSKVKDDD